MAKLQIRHISTCTIQPSSDQGQSIRRIELTPGDLRYLQIDYNQKGLLFNKPADQEQRNTLVQHLKASLSRTLTIFYPFAGRLAADENDDNTTSFFISCNGAGAQFVHAAADGIKSADIIDPVYPDDVLYNLFPFNAVRNYAGVSKPLLAVQVTELIDGIFIGWSINHVVGDGTSFWHFFNTWSEICRSDELISQTPPVCGRDVFPHIGVDLPIHMPFSYNEITGKLIRRSSDPLQRKLFNFSTEKIAELKAKANAEMYGTNNKISSLQALMAHLWRAATRSRCLNPDQEVMLWVTVGLRQRLKPPLPQEYLGNAVGGVFVKTTAGELLNQGLGWAASQINKQIASLTVEEEMKSMKNWARNPTFLSNLSNPASTSLIVVGSPRFNVYGTDFGWGRPLALRSGPHINMRIAFHFLYHLRNIRFFFFFSKFFVPVAY